MTLVTAAGVGLASSLHCAAMCGPLVGASCGSWDGGRGGWRALSYALARLLGYGAVGALAGALGAPLSAPWQVPLRVAAAAVAAFVLGRAGWKLLRRGPDPALTPLGRGPRPQPGTPASKVFPPGLLGLATSVFPCGALAGGVLFAAGTGAPWVGALSMMAFAIASLPALLGVVFGAAAFGRFLRKDRLVLGALLLVLSAVSFVEGTLPLWRGHHRRCCELEGR